MNAPEGRIDPEHGSTRSGLRTLGAILLGLGVLLIVFGACRMFSPAWTAGPDPTKGFFEGRRSFDDVSRGMDRQFRDSAWTSFSGFGMVGAGMFCALVGGIMLKFGYMGRVARYAAEEVAPVATDTINYLGANSRQGVHDLTQAVAGGIHDGFEPSPADLPPALPTQRICPRCQTANPAASRFCNHCGRPLEP